MTTKNRNIVVYLPAYVKSNRDILRGLLQYANENGGWTCEILDASGASINGDERDLMRRPDATICYQDGSATARRLNALRIPQARVFPDIPDASRPANSQLHVFCRSEEVGRGAAAYLAELQPASFAFIGRIPSARWSKVRRKSFCDELAKRGHTATLIGVRRKGDPEKLAASLVALPRPAAVLAENDRLARTVHMVCRQAKLAIPYDILLMGVDDDEILCETTTPPISSVQMDSIQCGFQTGKTLDWMISNPGEAHEPSTTYDFCNIVIRRSTRIMNKTDSLVDMVATCISQLLDKEREDGKAKVEDVCKRIGCSRRSLETNFLQLSGRTLHQEILRQRVKRATALLADKSVKLESIAQECGFSSVSHFRKVFQQFIRKSPAKYRDA